MRERTFRLLAIVSAVFLYVSVAASCGGDGDTGNDKGRSMGADAGMEDGGGNSSGGDGSEAACTYFPDDCPKGKNCYSNLTAKGKVRECREFEAGTSKGDACEAVNECGDGLRCFQNTCRTMCDPDNTSEFGCGSGAVCMNLKSGGYVLDWGFCEKIEDKCKVWPNDDCPKGENCYEFEQGKRCRTYDENAKEGEMCEGARDCNADQVCLTIENQGAGHCRPKCDKNNPCDDGRCADLPDDPYGACIPQMGN